MYDLIKVEENKRFSLKGNKQLAEVSKKEFSMKGTRLFGFLDRMSDLNLGDFINKILDFENIGDSGDFGITIYYCTSDLKIVRKHDDAARGSHFVETLAQGRDQIEKFLWKLLDGDSPRKWYRLAA